MHYFQSKVLRNFFIYTCSFSAKFHFYKSERPLFDKNVLLHLGVLLSKAFSHFGFCILRQKKAAASKAHRYYLEHQRTRGKVSKNIASYLYLHNSAKHSRELK